LELEHGYLKVVPLGQQLSELGGTIVFHEDWAGVEKLTARDRNGTLTLKGSAQLDGPIPTSVRLELKPDQFPVRQEASILARLTGNAILEADVGPEETDATITIEDLTVRMPDEPLRSLQELEPHSDVSIAGVDREAGTTSRPYRFQFNLRSPTPFWVRRQDFAAQVETDLTAEYEEPELRLTGFLELNRGFFEVFGKRFEVDNGRLDFAGDPSINPAVTLVAVHELPSRPGETVTVTVTGRLTRPTVQFASSIQDCSDRGAVISLLVSGRCGGERRQAPGEEQQAGQQAADFLAGITAGVLTLTAREEFGDVLPVIVIESGGQAFRSARVRAGFQADSFIPDFLRSVVRGAYVEGFFTAGSTDDDRRRTTTSQRRDHGFLLELQFPYNIVGTGSFSPPDTWSVDLTWEP
jgi:translocation and assembly module TamB